MAFPPALHKLRVPPFLTNGNNVREEGRRGPVSEYGRTVGEVLIEFFRYLETHAPSAIVGHDITGDVNLLVSEAVLNGLSCSTVPSALHRLVCTRMLATQPCGIPLPPHLRYPFPCDATLQQLNDLNHQSQDSSVTRNQPIHPTQRAPQYKWPSLEESYNLLGRVHSTPVFSAGFTDRTIHPVNNQPQRETTGNGFPVHDARGDVERCRAVFVRLMMSSSCG